MYLFSFALPLMHLSYVNRKPLLTIKARFCQIRSKHCSNSIDNASDLEKKTIPSYVYIEGYEFFVTYEGQMSMCRYCSQPNHKQLDCFRTKEDYPQPPIVNGNRQKGKHADPTAEKNRIEVLTIYIVEIAQSNCLYGKHVAPTNNAYSLKQGWGTCGLCVHTAHVMLGLPYVLLFNISAY